MKLIENSTITLYKIPFVDENLFDFHDNSVNSEEFSTNFHSALYTFATIANRLLFTLSDARSIKITDASLQLVLPIKKSRIEGYTLIECKTNELHLGFTDYVYFNIDSITSLNDNDTNPSCQLFCSINYYYSYLFDIQLSMENTQVNFSSHHVNRYVIKSGSDTAVIRFGVEGCTGVTFNNQIKKTDYIFSVLWLYVAVDEDTQLKLAGYEDRNIGYNLNVTNFNCERRLYVLPYGIISDNSIKRFTSVTYRYRKSTETVNTVSTFPVYRLLFSNNLIDAFITNEQPPISYYVDNNDNITVDMPPLHLTQKVGNTTVRVSSSYFVPASSASLTVYKKDGDNIVPDFSIECSERPNSNKWNYAKVFAGVNTNVEELKIFNPESDPAFGLYPFTSISTIAGELTYAPTRFGETLNIDFYGYYRSINFIAKSIVNQKQLFYLNSWENCDSFVYLEKDLASTFYRNNGGQYRVKMTTERAKAAVNIVSGFTKMGIAGAFPSVKAGQAFSGGNSLVNKFVPGSIRPGALTFAGENSAAQATNGIIDLVSSHAMKEAIDGDMNRAQNDYQNVTSQSFGSCQMFVFINETPNVDSEEFKQLAYQIYYYGYPREEIGMAGENNRIIYDYKKVSAIYSEITNNSAVSAYMKTILLNGATFWHLENLSSLTSDQKRQIITTANKYGIANYEPNLD